MPEITNSIVQTTAPEDRAGNNKTIYDVSLLEVFARNLVAGMGWAAGNILLYFVFIFVLSFWFIQVIWPRIQPLVNNYNRLVNSVEGIQKQVVPAQETYNPGIQELIDYYQGNSK